MEESSYGTCYDWNASTWLRSPPTPPLAPGSSDVDHSANSAQWVLLGVALVLVAVAMLALGSNLQRYALTMEWCAERRLGPCSCETFLYLTGLIIYFSGNGVFVVGLGLAPASLCASLIASVVVFNALIARLLNDEKLHR